jgi:hypothetical protein
MRLLSSCCWPQPTAPSARGEQPAPTLDETNVATRNRRIAGIRVARNRLCAGQTATFSRKPFDLGAQIGCGRFDGFGCVEHGLRRSARFGRSASYFVEHRYNLVRFPGSACHVMRNLSGRGILLLHRRGHSCGKLLDLLHAIGDLPGFCLFDERDLRRRQRAQRRRRVLTAAERNATLLGVLMRLPTAPALPPGENGDFGMSPICGQLLHKPLLAFVYSRGVRDMKHNRDREIKRRAPSCRFSGQRG